jgi:hypothetical protein
MDLTELFCEVDDFYRDYLQTFSNTFLPALVTELPQYCRLDPSEVMTIVIHFHQSSYRSLHNFLLNLITVLIAYSLQPKKPSLKLDDSPQNFFTAVPI